ALSPRGIALSPVGLRPGQAAPRHFWNGHLRRRRAYHEGLQYGFGLTASIGIGSPHNYSPPHGPRPPGPVHRPPPLCPTPRDSARSARPFFCGLLGPIQQYLVPVDPLQRFIALSQLLPGLPKGGLLQPAREPPLYGFVGGKPWG